MRSTKATMIALIVAVAFGCSLAEAQQPATLASAPTAKKAVGFRLAEWKTAHFHDVTTADNTETTLNKIGCETERHAHDGNIDLKYRCVEWKQLNVETDEQLAQWYQWLGEREMSTMIVDPPASINLVTVRYRLNNQGHLHVHNEEEAANIQQVLEMLGCDVTKADHNGHIDLTFNCPEWKTVGFPDHPIAHSWQAWLNQQGFATEHKH